jgi:hypothetical protein
VSTIPDEYENGLSVPDCSVPATTNFEAAWCRAQEPQGILYERVTSAFDRIRDRGAECAEIADHGMMLLQTGQLRFFDAMPGDAGRWGDWDVGVILADYWVHRWYTTAATPGTQPMNLEFALIHEVDHTLGLNHTDTPQQTPHTKACSGLYP